MGTTTGRTGTAVPWSPAAIAEARAWVADCMWNDDPADLAELSDAAIVRGVNRHYDGGMPELVRNGLV